MVLEQIIPTPQATTLEQADAIAHRLVSRKDDWLRVSIPERITCLQQCIKQVQTVAETWANAACRAKGIDPNSNLAGEEWFLGPICTLFNLRLLIDALRANGQPQPGKVTQQNGQAIAQVFPASVMDRLILPGFTGEVWLEPGQPSTQGRSYREKPATGQLALVLGAGNVSSIAPMDALYKLFAEDAVVLLKMNPVNEYMGKILEVALNPLRQAGFLEIVYGGAELGSYLCQHPEVDTIHITGSHHTHDAIVWGSSAEEQTWRKETNQPLNTKPITSELGCVTPVIVVPDRWSSAELLSQAHQIAEMVAHNASFNCAAAKVVVTDRRWEQRQQFLDLLRHELATIPSRRAYYPGAEQRYQNFLHHYPQAETLSPSGEGIVPWTLLPDVPAQAGELALTQEAFCGVLAEVSLEATNTGDFLAKAVEFVNGQVWGNLSCTLLVHPATQKRWKTQMENAIAQLQYGAIGVNVWSAVAFSLPMLPWGAFPGNSLADIRSGRGFVHNAYLFDYLQKTVVRAPFRIFPTPAWYSSHKNLLQLARRTCELQADLSWGNFLKAAIEGMQG
jgi:acyl-CoA reductase-like NAD-dependent aldehyde dehydrogenase